MHQPHAHTHIHTGTHTHTHTDRPHATEAGRNSMHRIMNMHSLTRIKGGYQDGTKSPHSLVHSKHAHETPPYPCSLPYAPGPLPE
mmetsp:Transcript_28056/g.70072  ORF Transcript_28056/g.70072 Transcript_28056/m.70072 type:complete len:85 (-) Transcript_28056:156-410(-)